MQLLETLTFTLTGSCQCIEKVRHVKLHQLVPGQTRLLAVLLALLLSQELRGQRKHDLVQSQWPGGSL